MSQKALASESAAVASTNIDYGTIVTLSDQGGVPGLEAQLVKGFDALQTTAVPALPVDVAHALRTMRTDASEVLKDVKALSGFKDPKALDMLSLADPIVREELVAEARKAVAQRSVEAGMGWTQSLGAGLGGKVRNTVQLFNEGGVIGLAKSFGKNAFGFLREFEDERISVEVEKQIQTRFAGKSFDALADKDKEMVLRALGRLAPNTLTFNQQSLLEWAYQEKSTVSGSSGAPLTYYELCTKLMGGESVEGRYAMPILALIQKNPTYRRHLEALFEHRSKEKPVQTAYIDEKKRHATEDKDRDTVAERIQHIEAALKLLSQIREQEAARAAYRQKVSEQEARIPKPSSSPPGSPTPPVPPGTKEIEVSIRGYADKELLATTTLSRLVTDLKSQYKSELTYAGKNLSPKVDFKDLLQIVASTSSTPPSSNPGGLNSPTQPNDLIDKFQTILDDDAGTFGATTIKFPGQTLGLRNQLTQIKEHIAHRDEPYSASYQPELAAAGYKNFPDLKTKSESAAEKIAEAARLTPHQLLYELFYRQFKVEIPPPTTPSLAKTKKHHLEEAQIRAVIETAMQMDRADSSMDEGVTVRTARDLTRNRVSRLLGIKGDRRLTFKEVLKQFTKDPRFKGLKGITLKTTANDIVRLINEEKLKKEDLPEAMRELELLGQDQWGGKGDLELGVDVRPLLYQFQLASLRFKAEPLIAKINDSGVANKAETLLAMLKEEAPKMVPDPVAPGSEPLKLETRSEHKRTELISTLRETLKEIGEESPEGQLVKKRLSYLEQFSSQFLADAFFNVMARLPAWWRRRKAVTAATKSIEKIPGVIQEGRRAIADALEDVTELAPAGAHS